MLLQKVQKLQDIVDEQSVLFSQVLAGEMTARYRGTTLHSWPLPKIAVQQQIMPPVYDSRLLSALSCTADSQMPNLSRT